MVMNGKNLRFWLFFLVLGCFSITHADGIPGLDKIKHIIVIYQENWSFDGLYGNFPGAEGFPVKLFCLPSENESKSSFVMCKIH